eukprot:7862017-Pyramimonas_sp.AAC.1
MERTIRLRLVLRGFMDLETFDVETFSGTARRPSQILLASAAACKRQWTIVPLDINMAFLKGLSYRDLAGATGEKERAVCFTLPPGSATVLRALPGFENNDESNHCLQRTTSGFGLLPTSYDEGFETSTNLLTAKHVDDINMACTEVTIDKYVKRVEDMFGKCKLNQHTYTSCAVRYTKDEDGNVTLDQDDNIKQLCFIQHPELTGADADAQATKMVGDMCVSRRGSLEYELITQVWLLVYVVPLQRVQEPTNIQVRRLHAITRKLQACPKKIVYQAMNPTGE